MDVRERTELDVGVYFTDGCVLVYVIDIADEGQAMIVEDVLTGRVYSVPPTQLYGWRIVVPAEASNA